jgi:hypothetical protein
MEKFQIKFLAMELKFKSLRESLTKSRGRHEAKRTNFMFLIPKSRARKIELQCAN